MDSDQKCWLCFLTLCAIVLSVLIVSITTYNIKRNNNILIAIEKGHDPVDAAIAFDNIMDSKITAAKLGNVDRK